MSLSPACKILLVGCFENFWACASGALLLLRWSHSLCCRLVRIYVLGAFHVLAARLGSESRFGCTNAKFVAYDKAYSTLFKKPTSCIGNSGNKH